MIDREKAARIEEQRQTAAAMAATLRLTRRYRLEETPPGAYRRVAWLAAAALVVVALAAFELYRPAPREVVEAIGRLAPLPRCALGAISRNRATLPAEAGEAPASDCPAAASVR